ncbi:MAG: hypothetical protein A3C08_00465 [Candidatus Taylorbacteria bacterium RIFCSPHIGHO2_02_FULL_47_18]|uniref:Uncharacterized protein n=1 Tax=Candidatus Taylorbacteria bacterium RIFCSPLOWO2_01_FULL_48_100 TaxID=1802322 RepID=A0A1G2NCX8_9BACT|nr:MAG: hypothetical protein A2670_00180 [Candidatus Taylorbacteria bacterium RIFCSPHIGHO2_01_FULL_48_38]OHA27833.1 MAG: hypothetical protein A3C08_00465 [Candidatus Taylorbacteria bacterium RIFCSPHIGHO2_02_FULL_47_18]OHA33944.1 MAG: hypothetical protein A2938_02905 [Candidatus Taylorbacteria bacterium RIFCSPLOWO2_01_FULL_48_100]OHA40919.1 MAG: hypothetical protein A3J31_03910 [Candidatus Taylorbacteria bacterium RIFCSPLOWO2_02_FULL_48_16]OHA45071.1 MAG: hypothetical protein A3H13_02665 [Candid
MKPTTSRKTIIIEIVALVVLALFLFVSVQRGSPPNGEADIAAPQFTAPMYADNESPNALIRPLYLDVLVGGLAGLTAEKKQNIADFKQKILTRIASREPLSESEKSVLQISISTAEKPPMGAIVVADQTVFNFTSEELARIESAIKK